jgi:hypothetical protein
MKTDGTRQNSICVEGEGTEEWGTNSSFVSHSERVHSSSREGTGRLGGVQCGVFGARLTGVLLPGILDVKAPLLSLYCLLACLCVCVLYV